MRIYAIRGCNLASLAGEFAIELDQEPLSHAGLFAITGPTGAGKSTLLDALCVALFDRTPRLGARSAVTIGRADDHDDGKLSATDVRALLRHGTGAGWAEVEFAGRDGHRYRARWTVRRARNRPGGRFQPQQMELHQLPGGRALGGTKSETLAAIEERIGFTFEQFRRSALLAQGEFAAFLQASARQRAELLERMTGTEIYGAVSEAAYRRAQDEIRELADLQRREGEQAILDDDARDAVERQRAAAADALARARDDLAEIDRAVAWHHRLGELTRGEEAAAAELDALEQRWNDGADARAELARARAALAVADRLDAVDRARRGEAEAGAAVAAAATEIAAAADESRDADRALQAAAAADRSARERAAGLAPALANAARVDTALALAREAANEANEARAAAERAAAVAEGERVTAATRVDRLRARLVEADAWLSQRADVAGVVADWGQWDSALGRLVDADGEIAALDVARPARVDEEEAAREAAAARTRELGEARGAHDKARASCARAEKLAAEKPVAELRQTRARLESDRDALRDAAAAAESAAGAAASEAEATAEVGEANAAIGRLRARIKQLDRDAADLLARRDEAERALDQLRLAVDLSVHRGALVDGEACPLCGALDHPWADRQTPVDRALDDQRQRVDGLRQSLVAIERERAECEAERKARAADARKAERRARAAVAARAEAGDVWVGGVRAMGELPLIADAASGDAAEWVAARIAAIDERLESMREREADAGKLASRAAEARSAVEARRSHVNHAADAVRAAERRLRDAVAALRAVDDERARAVTGRDRLRAELGRGLSSVAGAAAAIAAEPAALRARLGDEVAGYRERQRIADESRAELAELQAALEAATARAGERARARGEAERLDSERAGRVAALVEERAALLDGRPVLELRGELDGAIAAAASALDDARRRVETAAARAAAASAAAAAARDRQASATAERRRAESELTGSTGEPIDEAAVRALLARGRDWIDTAVAEHDSLRASVESARAVLAERKAQRARHLAGDRPALAAGSTDETAAARAAAEAAFEAAQQTVAELTSQLKIDDLARARRAEIGAEIASQRDRAALYRSLSDLIGSADGKKFRQFAQSLTLDALLAFANDHLGELASRYRLARVPGFDLDLQVIDRDMGDEVRSVNSLSGGESFLVSLSLALGLSSLSARDVRVESLLIDEGFGSLDPSTLEVALSVLDALQATGRKVGLISHVPGLAERIGVCVNVTPRGGGKSVVQVAGG